MIHHLSISAENPQHVAQVLAEILQGQATPHPFSPDGYIVFPFDEYGTEIEVYSLGTEITPGDSEEKRAYIQNPAASKFTATHFMISVPASAEQIEQIAQREDWLMERASFGFDFILLWVENRLLIELLTPEITTQYIAFTKRENLRKYFVFPDSDNSPKS
ncbi:hypothetical protein WKK05_15000 [Nostoc sp. UHCC 0302]|uniref:hypothetical protein n=1 Tax=Nostoc sp. UHCC 0302 TaxID=3134896 RepID=UPI00311CA1CB